MLIKHNKFLIRSDGRQYILATLKKDKQPDITDGDFPYQNYGNETYHATLESLLNKMFDLNIKNSNATSFSELRTAIDEAHDDIKNISKQLNI